MSRSCAVSLDRAVAIQLQHSLLTRPLDKPKLVSIMLGFFANFVWINLPPRIHAFVSRYFSVFFSSRISKYIIVPYCFVFELDFHSLQQFEPSGENSEYASYSDFFTRKYKTGPKIKSDHVWPCEGYVCDWGWFKDIRTSVVKGTRIDLNLIFRSSEKDTLAHYFTNIFLHNHNYHRIHSPSTLKVEEIIHLNGHLNFLRPWFYKRDQVSYPSVKNERTIIRFSDANMKSWYLALVGGFGVGSIVLADRTQIGMTFYPGDEIAHFKLGSTVCMASPYEIPIENYLQKVVVGQDLEIQSRGLNNVREL